MWLYTLTPDSDRFEFNGTNYLYMSVRWIPGKGKTNAKNLTTDERFWFDPHKTEVTNLDDHTDVRRTPPIVCRDSINIHLI